MSLPLSDVDPRGQAWRLFIETSARLTTAIDDQLRRDAGLTLADYHVLLLLSETPQHRMRMKEIAQRMVFSPSRLTYQVGAMCQRGWLRREPVPEDRRGTYAILTAEGQAAFTAAARGHHDLVQQMFFTALTPAQGRELTTLMSELDAHLNRMDTP